MNMVLGEGCLPEIFCNTVLESPGETDMGRDVPWRSVRQKVSGVRAAAWIGKGLAMRGHNGVSFVASGLLRLLLSGASEVTCHKFDFVVALKVLTSL